MQPPTAVRPSTEYGREICGDPDTACAREWIITNGIGGFASGTIGDVLTRRYHGLLFAALNPPLGRTLLLAKLDATASYAGHDYGLSANRWADGSISPQGFRDTEHVRLEGTIPTWRYAFSDVSLERTIWMHDGANTTYIRYTVRRASEPVTLTLRALVNARDYHSLTHAYDVGEPVAIDGQMARVQLGSSAPAFVLATDRGELQHGGGWYYGFELAAEAERGLDQREDHYNAITVVVTLAAGESVTIMASAEMRATVSAADDALAARIASEAYLLATFQATRATSPAAPEWIRRLVLAADQFIVARNTTEQRGQTVIAGYPWFGDWGRDTMIALPGLALATGRPDVARTILATFAQFLDQGMLPNRFPDAGEAPEYNTVDATLWFVEAIRRYVEATGDRPFAHTMRPAIDHIIHWHTQGTRYNIHVDPADGLLFSGEPGVQLTWMDAKVGDYVVTPRTGKAVEINALWYRALRTAQAFAAFDNDAVEMARYAAFADRVRASFDRFWNAARGYSFDVIDGPEGDDPAVRPNAVIAASLPDGPFSQAQCAHIVRTAARSLVTTAGLRTLAPDDEHYVGRYGGDQYSRDTAYHQGTVWPWLLGPFATAHFAVFGDRDAALELLDGMRHFIDAYALGTLAEIAEGDAPHLPRGCIAQAWSVSEILHAWTAISGASF